VRRSATGSAGSKKPAGSAKPDVVLGRAITGRNVALAVLGPVVLVLKSGYHGPLEDVVNAHAGNVAVSFALYFAAINATSRHGRSRLIAAALTLLAVELFEVTNGFGVMKNVYDPADFVANAVGVSLAVIVDIATSPRTAASAASAGRPDEWL
jgi:hypothetical protein